MRNRTITLAAGLLAMGFAAAGAAVPGAATETLAWGCVALAGVFLLGYCRHLLQAGAGSGSWQGALTAAAAVVGLGVLGLLASALLSGPGIAPLRAAATAALVLAVLLLLPVWPAPGVLWVLRLLRTSPLDPIPGLLVAARVAACAAMVAGSWLVVGPAEVGLGLAVVVLGAAWHETARREVHQRERATSVLDAPVAALCGRLPARREALAGLPAVDGGRRLRTLPALPGRGEALVVRVGGLPFGVLTTPSIRDGRPV